MSPPDVRWVSSGRAIAAWWCCSFENLHQFFRSFNKPIRLACGHPFPIPHPLADGTDPYPGLVAAVALVCAVSHQHGSFCWHVETFHDVQQHPWFRFQPESVVPADHELKVLGTKSLENDIGILDRFVRGDGLPLVFEMDERFLDTRVEDRPV